MKPPYIYNLDDHPPIRHALLYGFQWAMIMFPVLIIAASLSVGSFPSGTLDKVYFLQMTLLTSGLFTWLQSVWGHRYPLLEGPSTALMLAFILVAPLGLPTIQGGMIQRLCFPLCRRRLWVLRCVSAWEARSGSASLRSLVMCVLGHDDVNARPDQGIGRLIERYMFFNVIALEVFHKPVS